jgi:hypothetical protein
MEAGVKVAIAGVILVAALSASSHTMASYGGYNPEAAYGACQEDGLRGVHYAREGDCPNWEAWKASHAQGQTSPHRRSYPRPGAR